MEFDYVYANQRIDHITYTYEKMVNLYEELTKASPPSKEDMAIFREMYTSVMTSISEYYSYLNKIGITPKESYLTKWLEGGPYYLYHDALYAFCCPV